MVNTYRLIKNIGHQDPTKITQDNVKLVVRIAKLVNIQQAIVKHVKIHLLKWDILVKIIAQIVISSIFRLKNVKNALKIAMSAIKVKTIVQVALVQINSMVINVNLNVQKETL